MAKRRRRSPGQRTLFIEDEQMVMLDKSYEQDIVEKKAEEEKRERERQRYLEILKEKLKDPEFRKIEGFPIGKDEDILALSDPPYYTACPNPFIGEIVEKWQWEKHLQHHKEGMEDTNGDEITQGNFDPGECQKCKEADEQYHREPFATDVSEGKNDPIYNAHSYHTKVPHKAIMRYILHYTEPGDIVFDGFCGTGMTGVGAQMCGDKDTVRSLGYRLKSGGSILDKAGKPFSKLGGRRAILNDLCPSATFIAYNYNTPVDPEKFEREAKRILSEVERECGWMYLTLHKPSDKDIEKAIEILNELPENHASGVVSQMCPGVKFGRINYTVWSDVFICPECAGEVVFWEAAVDKKEGKVQKEFPCPHCDAMLTKRKMERAWVTTYDDALGQTVRQAKQVPVLVNYTFGRQRNEKEPDDFDLALIEKIGRSEIPYWFPTDRMPEGYNTKQPKVSHGITHVHHFYTRRNLRVLGAFVSNCQNLCARHTLFLLSALNIHVNKMRRFQPVKPGGTPGLPGTLYVSAISVELPIFDGFPRKFRGLERAFEELPKNPNLVATTSAGSVGNALHEVVDYIFTDPPFGGNLMCSELNFLWEAWLKVFTNNEPEAVINSVQKKGLAQYQELMIRCFEEYYRVLKPGRWMTVEFHNSKNSVWNAIQEALQRAGFVVADVRTLDKKQGSFKQVTTASAVRQDLIISCYKPAVEFEERFKLEAGTEEGVWDFAKTHLRQLPVFVAKGHLGEVNREREKYLLFDRMVAFHVQRGISIPLSAGELYAGLERRFVERDGMYFLPEQAAEYDKKRMMVESVEEMELFVTDERTAVQWLRRQLTQERQTRGEIQPKFLRELHQAPHEKLPELLEMLSQNFLEDEEDRWYVPDPNKEADLEKLREKALLREFDEYVASKGKLKVFRTEAVRAGFKSCWAQRDYRAIVSVSSRLPERILQEDPNLLMYYDNAMTRTEG